MSEATQQRLLNKAAIGTNTWDFGGRLNPEQQERFFVKLRGRNALLSLMRFKVMQALQSTIDRLHIGQPVTESVDENTDTGNTVRPKASALTLEAKKVRSAWDLPIESLQDNIEGSQLEDTLLTRLVQRIGVDVELLILRGDTAITGSDPHSRLLRRLDGLEKLSDRSHVVDAENRTINKELFAEAKRKLPPEFRKDPNLAFFVPSSLSIDWESLQSERGTNAGDNVIINGQEAQAASQVLGIPIFEVPLMSDDLPLDLTEAMPAELFGVQAGPFEIRSGVNDQLNLNITINSVPSGTIPITFNAGVFQAVEIVNAIQQSIDQAGVDASVLTDGEGRLVIRSGQAGSSNSITVEAGSTAASELGLEGSGLPNTVTGVDAGESGELREGGKIILTNPLNLILGMFAGTRIANDYLARNDRIETTVYNQLDFQVEDLDAMVSVNNVRKKTLS